MFSRGRDVEHSLKVGACWAQKIGHRGVGFESCVSLTHFRVFQEPARAAVDNDEGAADVCFSGRVANRLSEQKLAEKLSKIAAGTTQ
jgi:hypothetical protein